MAGKPKKLNKKPMTLEDFAMAIQTDLARVAMKDDIRNIHDEMATIRAEMATKEDLRKIREEMATTKELNEVRADVKMITDVMVSKADLERLREDLLHEMKYGNPIEELRERLEVVEKKLGITHGRRAA
jgi:hypothetical protein